MTLPLFNPSPSFNRAALSRSLQNLSRQGIWIGTSSWKYQGWLDQIYTPERYLVRGRFSPRKFQAECLNEYAETFSVVCGDFSFYQFPAPDFWRKLFSSGPLSLRFALKVPEEVTAEEFPEHARYGRRAGTMNESYLNADVLRTGFLEPLKPHAERIATLIFEFGARGASTRRFVNGLDSMRRQLPDTSRYAVEVRNPEYLAPGYFACLAGHGVAHVLNAWTRMPELGRQVEMPGAETAEVLSDVAFCSLFVREFPKALAASDRGHTLDPHNLIIETNRAHALMFMGREDEAKALYLAHKGEPLYQNDKGEPLWNSELWERGIADDFEKFRKAGLTSPMMPDIEKELAIWR